MSKVYFVVADQSRARIFTAKAPLGRLREVDDIIHPEARQHDSELGTDKPGSNAGTDGARHAMPSRETLREHEAQVFARTLAEHIEQQRVAGGFAQLVLIAPPHFLGMLRDELSAPCQKMLIRSVDKNLTTLSADEVREHLLDA